MHETEHPIPEKSIQDYASDCWQDDWEDRLLWRIGALPFPSMSKCGTLKIKDKKHTYPLPLFDFPEKTLPLARKRS
jgi:hypothetical protein